MSKKVVNDSPENKAYLQSSAALLRAKAVKETISARKAQKEFEEENKPVEPVKSVDGLSIVPMQTEDSAVLNRLRKENAILRRAKGESYTEIASALGVTPIMACRMVGSAIKYNARRIIESLDDVRYLESKRLDMMLVKLWPGVDKGDTDAIKTALLIMKRRAEMSGLDAPKKFEVEDHTDIDMKLHGIIAEIRAGISQPTGQIQGSLPPGKVPVTLAIEGSS